jgi:glycosyltransferase involved in cell wall biosynthesis
VTGFALFADLGFSGFTKPLLTAVLRRSADLYIAHYPAALPAAANAARRHGGRYAYDAEDFHLGDWPDGSDYDTERRFVRSIEKRYLQGCTYVTAASPGIADAFVEAYGIKRPDVVLNVFPLTQAPLGPTIKGTAEPRPSLYWFSQTIGPDRGLECAVRAIGLAGTRPHLYLRGTPVVGFVNRLEEIAAEWGAAGRLHILPPDEPDKMEWLAASYDIGLAAENGKTRSRAVALTNKLFTYLLAGIPPVLSDTPGQRAFATRAGMRERLYPVDDAETLAAIIDGLLEDPARLAAARAEAYRLGREKYNWDHESRVLVKTVRRVVERAPDQAALSLVRS